MWHGLADHLEEFGHKAKIIRDSVEESVRASGDLDLDSCYC